MSGRFVHPEATPEEVCIGNVYKVDFAKIGWSTKRMGEKPYDSFGAPLRGGNMRPAFVQRSELEAAGAEIPNIGPIDHRW